MNDNDMRFALCKQVDNEFLKFRKSLVSTSTEHVFDKALEISIKRNIVDFLWLCNDEIEDDCVEALVDFGPGLLDEMYNEYCNNENASADNPHNTKRFVIDFAERLI